MTIEGDLAKLEAKTLKAAAGSWLAGIDEIRELLALESPLVRSRILALIAPNMEVAARAALGLAVDLGVGNAMALVGQHPKVDVGKINPRALLASPAASALLEGLTSGALEALDKSKRLARAGAPLDAMAAPLLANAAKTRRSMTDAINLGANQGATGVADAAGLPTVWQAETNACVDCLAYSGLYAKPGDSFPGGVTYGAKSYFPEPVSSPPRHPNCRCTVEPLLSFEYAAALRREADRSVLRGFSLEGESMARRVDAADRLLARSPDAPKSVIAYSRKSVAAGKFPTRGRPNGEPGSPPSPSGPAPRNRPGPGAPPTPPTRPSGPAAGPPRPPTSPKSTPPAAPKSTAAARDLTLAKAKRASLPKATKVAPELDPKVPLSTTIKTAKTPAEAAAMVRARHLGRTEVLGFDAPKVDLKQAQDVLGTYSDLLDKYPNLDVTAIEAMTIRSKGTIAQVRTPVIKSLVGGTPTKVLGVPRVEVSLGYLRNPTRLNADVAHANKVGHFHSVDEGSPMVHAITHEFGHVLDSNIQGRGGGFAATSVREAYKARGFKPASADGYEWLKLNASGYARTSRGEHVAEAFADVETNGAKASDLSKDLYARLIDAYGKL